MRIHNTKYMISINDKGRERERERERERGRDGESKIYFKKFLLYEYVKFKTIKFVRKKSESFLKHILTNICYTTSPPFLTLYCPILLQMFCNII